MFSTMLGFGCCNSSDAGCEGCDVPSSVGKSSGRLWYFTGGADVSAEAAAVEAIIAGC